MIPRLYNYFILKCIYQPCSNYSENEKQLHQGNELLPIYALKYISKVRGSTSRGGQTMSTSKASIWETVFMRLKQYLTEH